MSEYSIQVSQLKKTFPGFELGQLSFTVPKGRIVGFIGENGAGKSTTIHLLLDILKKDSGDIRLFGLDHQEQGCEAKEQIGIVFDDCCFPEKMTPGNLERTLRPMYKNWDTILYYQYLAQFNLPLKKKIRTFSKGMKIKLSLAAALAHKPKLLILDEATSGLDPVMRDELLDLFLDYIQDEEHSIFFSTHITSDVEKIADYVIMLHQGRVLFQEQKDNLAYQYGIMRCTQDTFSRIPPEDYLAYRNNRVNIECLVTDREEAARKYPEAVVDRVTLDQIMIFFIKGTPSPGKEPI